MGQWDRTRLTRLLVALVCIMMLLDPVGALAGKTLFLSQAALDLSVGQSERVRANQPVYWASGDPSVVAVTPNGEIQGLRMGEALVWGRAADGQSKALLVKVGKLPAPKSIRISPLEPVIELGKSWTLTAQVLPEGANQKVTWATSNAKVATVTQGVVTPKKEGVVRITARSKAKRTVTKAIKLTVVDPLKPQSITLTPETDYLAVGETRALDAVVLPVTADQNVTFASANESIARVSTTGVVTAIAAGRVEITAKTARGGLTATVKLVVLTDDRVTEVPLRTTAQSVTAMKANLQRIDDVYESALMELDSLSARGVVPSSDYDKRRRILINAFSMYRFPWYTQARVAYWTSSYNGRKDFLTGRIYYGMPYIQTGRDGQYQNRRFNVAKAISGGYYVKRSNGCYQMSSKRLAGRYVGNDCSAFVCMATFLGNGYSLSSSMCYLVTGTMASSSAFRTVSYDALRPGDCLVYGGSHTVMFLYYTNASRTRMMILEQGGGDLASDMHNTVTCSVVNRSSYTAKYTARRATFLSK